MNNKILIGSIIAVVILVLVSFTGVVGYQTTKSSTIARASPLFNIRTSRAIDKENKDLTRDYVGKGEESVLSIPKRDDRTALQQKLIDRISMMDDKTFNGFIGFLFKQIHKSSKIKDDKTLGLIMTLNQLKTNPENIKKELDNITDKPLTQDEFCTNHQWYFGCLLEWIMEQIFWFIIVLMGRLTLLFPGCSAYPHCYLMLVH